jgi:hypothetical protein
MNNYSSHVTSDVIGFLTEARVHVITFALHTIYIFQVLNVALSGLPKRRPKHESLSGDEKATVQLIMKAYQDFKQTMMESNR